MPKAAFRPVLKWAGGKYQLLEAILERLPARMRTYYEPFAGGAAVFFALAGEERFEHAVLGDVNRDLLSVYRALQKDVEGLVDALREHRERHSEAHFYAVRAARPRGLVETAARVIYLNKTGYNGLYRVNRSGQFNVPFGRYKKPNILDEARLRSAHEALKRTEIREGDFEPLVGAARPGDAVYFDPPYLPVSRTSKFTEYAYPFGIDEHHRLARVFAELARRGVHALLSNSASDEARRLYPGFRVERVQVARSINSNAARRGPVGELLVSGRS
jgi:DNA adenine methylase